jgi:hypothetical protein
MSRLQLAAGIPYLHVKAWFLEELANPQAQPATPERLCPSPAGIASWVPKPSQSVTVPTKKVTSEGKRGLGE